MHHHIRYFAFFLLFTSIFFFCSLSSSPSCSSSVFFTLSFRRFSLLTVTLPLFAFLFCLGYSYAFHFRRTTLTHCNVWNFAPSISASISLRPQGFIWKMCLALHSAPRLLLAKMYSHYFKSGLRGRFPRLVRTAFFSNILENLFLLLLSFAPSKDEFLLHKICFCGFIATSSAYILQSYVILNSLWWAKKTEQEVLSLTLKKIVLSVNLSCIGLALYFYYRHNKYCEPGVYSLFSICEYLIVLSNMGYHLTAYYDFYDIEMAI